MANKLISIIPSGTNNYLTPALSFNRLATDLVTPGVVGTFTSTTGAMLVSAQGTPNMTVAVAAGNAYVSATPTGGVAQTYGVTLDGSENVTISSNSSGSTAYDFIYLKADPTKLNNPAVNGLDVVTLVTSRSSTPYSTGTANGNSNGVQTNCLLLAVVTIANNATSITSGNIADGRVAASAVADAGVTTRRFKPSIIDFTATTSASAVNTTVDGPSTTYTTGPTPEKLILTATAMMQVIGAGGNGNWWVNINGVEYNSPRVYMEPAPSWMRGALNVIAPVPANTTVTIKFRLQGAAGGTANMNGAPEYAARITGFAISQ